VVRTSMTMALVMTLAGCNKSSPKKPLPKLANLIRVECMMSHSGGVDIFTKVLNVDVSRDGTVISLQDGSVTKYSPHVSCKVMEQPKEDKV
jgi:hypothetical protein